MTMSAGKQAQFAGQKYLSLETFKKDGQGVKTPVWFAEGDGVFYIYSLANAGKVKRIRNNPRVRLAPCDVRGRIKGGWVDGTARILDAEGAERGHRLLNQKYWLKIIGDIFSKLRKRQRAVIALRVE